MKKIDYVVRPVEIDDSTFHILRGIIYSLSNLAYPTGLEWIAYSLKKKWHEKHDHYIKYEYQENTIYLNSCQVKWMTYYVCHSSLFCVHVHIKTRQLLFFNILVYNNIVLHNMVWCKFKINTRTVWLKVDQI